jgi:hypothetical protein
MRSKQQLLFSPAGEITEGWFPVLAHIRANDEVAPKSSPSNQSAGGKGPSFQEIARPIIRMDWLTGR